MTHEKTDEMCMHKGGIRVKANLFVPIPEKQKKPKKDKKPKKKKVK